MKDNQTKKQTEKQRLTSVKRSKAEAYYLREIKKIEIDWVRLEFLGLSMRAHT